MAAEYGALHAGMLKSAAAEARSEENGGGGGGGGGRGEREQPSVLSLPALLSRWAQRLPRAYVVCVSAREGWGLAALQELLVTLSPLGPKYFPSDTVTNRDERFFASEIIREALLLCYQDEVPYSCEVQIEAFQVRPPTPWHELQLETFICHTLTLLLPLRHSSAGQARPDCHRRRHRSEVGRHTS